MISLPFPIEALHSFVVLAEELHFTRAAARVHVAQPALTKRIHLLERGLGVRLFLRTRRAVRLTSEGEALLPQARQVLAACERLLTAADRLRAGDTGRLRIGFTPSAPHHLLPPLMRAFRREHPDVTCLLNEMGSEEQVARLVAGDLDVGILRPPSPSPRELMCTTVFEEPYVAVLPRDHRLARQRTIPLSALNGEPFVLIARRVVATIHAQVLNACAAAGVVPRSLQEASHIHAVAALVSAGAGVSLLPKSAAELGVRGVVWRPLRGGSLHTVMAVARLRRQASPLAVAFSRSVVHTAARMQA